MHDGPGHSEGSVGLVDKRAAGLSLDRCAAGSKLQPIEPRTYVAIDTVALSAGETAGTASAVAATPSAAAEAKAKPTDTLRGLSAQDLRELADLEEARSLGQITVKQYEARRNEILQKTN